MKQREKIFLAADSPCDLSVEEAREKSIHIVPVTVAYGGRIFKEFYEIDPVAFYDVLTELDEIPATAQVTPPVHLESFEKARAEGCTHVIGVYINGAGSGTYASALTARELFYAEHGYSMVIELIDSRIYTALYGYPILKAAEMRDRGASFAEIVAALRDMLDRVEAPFLVYSLKHMKKSGRISGAAAFVGETLGLRPFLLARDTQVNVLDRVRGNKALVDRTISYMREHIDLSYPDQRFLLIRGKVNDEDVGRLESLLEKEYPSIPISRFRLGPSVAINAGPNLLAVGYFGKARGTI